MWVPLTVFTYLSINYGVLVESTFILGEVVLYLGSVLSIAAFSWIFFNE